MTVILIIIAFYIGGLAVTEAFVNSKRSQQELAKSNTHHLDIDL